MEKEFDFFSGLLCVIFGFSLSILFDFATGRMTMYAQYKKAIEQCEKELPRNKKCKIVAVVDESKSQ